MTLDPETLADDILAVLAYEERIGDNQIRPLVDAMLAHLQPQAQDAQTSQNRHDGYPYQRANG